MKINNLIPNNEWAFGNCAVGDVVYHEGLILMVTQTCTVTDISGVTEQYNAIDLDDGWFFYVEPTAIVERISAEVTVRPLP